MRIAIVGGGAVGSAVAYWLRRLSERTDVVVVERDPSYRHASSALSAGSIRQQFTTPVNIAASRFGVDFLRRAREHLEVDGDVPALGFTEGGYLLLAGEGGAERLARNVALQQRHGAHVAWLDRAALRRRFPWLSLEGIGAGALGLRDEGWFDGYALLRGLRRKAAALGARFLAEEVVGAERAGRRVTALRLRSGARLEADAFVNAAGPWASKVAALFGVVLPVEARRRLVFAFTCPDPPRPAPLVVDPSGLWFRPEGPGFIAGLPPRPEEDRPDLPLEVDHTLFEERLWPLLAARVPAFERLRVTGAWAGYYAYNTFDANALLGPHPELDNVLFANGFSGHGLQQAPAVGLGIAELLLFGRYRTLDLSPLALERVYNGTALREENVI